MNVLPIEKQIECIAALTEGVSIRATERLTGVHRDTIMRLGVRVGTNCANLHDAIFRDLHVNLIELDEIWGYVGKKQRHLEWRDGQDKGDQYSFIAMDRTTKAILSYRTGKRNEATTDAFLTDLRRRVVNVPHISSDAMTHYADAMYRIWGADVNYGQIIKKIAGDNGRTPERRYSPGVVVAVEKRAVLGRPRYERVSTSIIERQNLTVRMSQRRFTRLTNGFSKKLDNHCAAVSLYVAHYNLCRVHETVGATPAMAAGLTDHVWSVGELIMRGEHEIIEPVGKRVGPFRVIDGDKR